MSTEREMEIWEITIPGTVFVSVRDPRLPGGWKQTSVSGKGNKKLTISKDEREFNEEQLPEGNIHLNPFRNGILLCRQGELAEAKQYTDEELTAFLELDEADFKDAFEALPTEVLHRRLLAIAEKKATVQQHALLKDFVDEKYRVGGTQRTVREMQSLSDRMGYTLS